MEIKNLKYIVAGCVVGLVIPIAVFGCNAGGSGSGMNNTTLMQSEAKNVSNYDSSDYGSYVAINSSVIGKYNDNGTSKFLYAWVGYDGMFHRFVVNHYADSDGDVNMEPLTTVNLATVAPNIGVLNRVIYAMPTTGGSTYGRFIIIGNNGTLLMSTDNSASKFEKIAIPGDSSDLNLTHVIAQFDSNNNLVIIVTGERLNDNGTSNNEIYYAIDSSNGTFPSTPSSGITMKKLIVGVANSENTYSSMKFEGNNFILTDGRHIIEFKEKSTTPPEFDGGVIKYRFSNDNDPVQEILTFNYNNGSSDILLEHKSGNSSFYDKDGGVTSKTTLPEEYQMYSDPSLGGVINVATACQQAKGGACVVETVNFYTGGEIGMPSAVIQEILKNSGDNSIKSHILNQTANIFGGTVFGLAVYPGTDSLYSFLGFNSQGMAYVSKNGSIPGNGDAIWEQLLPIVVR